MKNPGLAETLQMIADNGANVLYSGPIANETVAEVSFFFVIWDVVAIFFIV